MTVRLEHERTYSAVDLALFAAATWNPHLIHLRPEAATADGLPGPVVQAHFLPATVLAVLDATGEYGTHELERVSWRNRAPVVEGQPVRFVLEPEVGGVPAWTWTAHVADHVAAEGEVRLRPRVVTC